MKWTRNTSNEKVWRGHEEGRKEDTFLWQVHFLVIFMQFLVCLLMYIQLNEQRQHDPNLFNPLFTCSAYPLPLTDSFTFRRAILHVDTFRK